MSVIEIKGLSKNFGSKKALDNVNLSIEEGEIFGFLGPNGAGKSTTLRCMMGAIFPDEGSIEIDSMKVGRRQSDFRKRVGYVPSDLQLNDNWTGTEHISFIQNARKINNDPTELISRLDIDVQDKAKHLSTGNRQKLAFLLALIHKPKVLLLDEPTKGLDPILQETMYEILQEFRTDGGCVFFSSHNLNEVERLCDRVGIIRSGKIVANETMDSLRHLHVHEVEAVVSDVRALDDIAKYGELILRTKNSISLRVEGDINPLLKALARHDLEDISINHASLEDIFLHFYEEKK